MKSISPELFILRKVCFFGCVFFLGLCNSTCKNHEIKVTIADVVTNDGVPGIKFYYHNEPYYSNANGEIIIESKSKIDNDVITTTLSQKGFVFEESIKRCEAVTSFPVSSGDNFIYVRKLSYLKLLTNWNYKNNSYPDSYSVCFRIPNYSLNANCAEKSCFNYSGDYSIRDDGIFVINYIQSSKTSLLEIMQGENVAIDCRDNCNGIQVDSTLSWETTYGDTTTVRLDIY